jgi:TPP-dependent pyruvate/acetoin dehydrogenase alpha subunit
VATEKTSGAEAARGDRAPADRAPGDRAPGDRAPADRAPEETAARKAAAADAETAADAATPIDAGLLADPDRAQPLAEPATYLAAYERMVLIREFETEIHHLFLKGDVHGTTHLSAGQEAVPVGVCLALEPDDFVAGTYRGHGHALAKGTDPEPLAAEMLGRATGVCGGRAGSMNVIDLEHGLVGCFGIVGGSIAAATGAAVTGLRRGQVAVAFFGDGAVNQAYFPECLNFAQVLGLPAVYVCENNFYGEFTPMQRVTGGEGIAARGAAFGVPALVVDGNDVLAVHQAAAEAVERARSGGGPTLLECQTYRHYGHSKSDPATYRPQDEVERWLGRDPLDVARRRLMELGVREEELDATAERAQQQMRRASQAALASPYPDPQSERATEFAS